MKAGVVIATRRQLAESRVPVPNTGRALNRLIAVSHRPGARMTLAAALTLIAMTSLALGATDPQFVTSDPNGGWSINGYYVHNNMWNSANYGACSSKLHAWSHDNWYVVTRMNNTTGDGAVKTYPNVHRNYRSVPLEAFDSLTSHFAETSPPVGIYNFAYDLWINGIARPGCTEIMIWTENRKQVPGGKYMQDVTFDNRTYQAYRNASGGYLAFVAVENFTSGEIDLLAIVQWAVAQGWLARNSTLDQICFGVEVVSTEDEEATFRVTAFSIDAKLKPGFDSQGPSNRGSKPKGGE